MNGPTEEFLEDLRNCVEAHKEFYKALYDQDVFSPVKDDPVTQSIDRIDRYLRRAKPAKLVDLSGEGGTVRSVAVR